MKTSVAWLSVQDAADHLGFSSAGAFRKFVERERARPQSRLKVHWLAGRMRFRATDLDRLVEAESASAPALHIVGGAR